MHCIENLFCSSFMAAGPSLAMASAPVNPLVNNPLTTGPGVIGGNLMGQNIPSLGSNLMLGGQLPGGIAGQIPGNQMLGGQISNTQMPGTSRSGALTDLALRSFQGDSDSVQNVKSEPGQSTLNPLLASQFPVAEDDDPASAEAKKQLQKTLKEATEQLEQIQKLRSQLEQQAQELSVEINKKVRF